MQHLSVYKHSYFYMEEAKNYFNECEMPISVRNYLRYGEGISKMHSQFHSASFNLKIVSYNKGL